MLSTCLSSVNRTGEWPAIIWGAGLGLCLPPPSLWDFKSKNFAFLARQNDWLPSRRIEGLTFHLCLPVSLQENHSLNMPCLPPCTNKDYSLVWQLRPQLMTYLRLTKAPCLYGLTNALRSSESEEPLGGCSDWKEVEILGIKHRSTLCCLEGGSVNYSSWTAFISHTCMPDYSLSLLPLSLHTSQEHNTELCQNKQKVLDHPRMFGKNPFFTMRIYDIYSIVWIISWLMTFWLHIPSSRMLRSWRTAAC